MQPTEILSKKLDQVTEELQQIKICMATRNQQEMDRQRKDEETMTIINNHTMQLNKHEVSIAQIKTKITLFGVGIVTLTPIVAAIVFKYLQN